MANDPCPITPDAPGQWMGILIGMTFILGSFCMFALVLLGYTKIEWKDIALVIVGALLNQCTTILSKWYTTSQGSERKTELMAAQAAALAAKVEPENERPSNSADSSRPINPVPAPATGTKLGGWPGGDSSGEGTPTS